MGGFVFEPDITLGETEKEVFGGHQRLTLTPRGVHLLAECGYLDRVLATSKDDIEDKSKTDHLSKIVTILQASWMAVEVISRIASDLPVTLLEVNTLGHVGCAFSVYLLWWDKPRQIKEPTILTGDWFKSLGAFMYLSSRISGRKGERRRFVGPGHLAPPVICRNNESNCADQVDVGDVQMFNDAAASPPSQTVTIQDSYKGTLPTEPSSRIGIVVDMSDEGAQERYRLAAQAIREHSALRARFSLTEENSAELAAEGEELLTATIPNWPTDCLLRSVNSLIMGVVLWSVTIVYGSVHTAAWNAQFPTQTEKWMWRASSLWVAASGVIWVTINLVARICPPIDNFWIAFNARKTHRLWDVPIGLLCALCGMAYIFSRSFLVIEAFLGLRKLPDAAYDTPQWTQVIPHL